MTKCKCGNHVSPTFARVFGDPSDGTVRACPNCASRAGIDDETHERCVSSKE